MGAAFPTSQVPIPGPGGLMIVPPAMKQTPIPGPGGLMIIPPANVKEIPGGGVSTSNGETVGFLVPNDRVPRVIGKAGQGLKQIREACGMKVEAKPEIQEGLVDPVACRLTLAGTPEQIVVAFAVALNRASNDDPVTKAELRIPSEWAGRAIGKGGETLKRARSMFNVQAQVGREKCVNPISMVEERLVTLEGPTDKLSQVLALMMTDGQGQLGVSALSIARPQGCGFGSSSPVMGASGHARIPDLGTGPTSVEEVCLHLQVADSMAGAVIGKKGAKIQETGNRAGCKLRMTSRVDGSDEPRRVIIVGSTEATAVAQSLLNDQLREAYMNEGHPEPTAFAITMLVRREACGAVIGRQGAGIKDLRDRSGAKIIIRSEQEVEGSRPCLIEGPLPTVLEAERLIQEICREVPMAEPGSDRRRSDSLPGMDVQGGCTGCGGVFAAAAAMDSKRRRLDGSLETEEWEGESRLLMPDQCVGLVIGKQGGNLKAMREKFGVKVEVKRPEEAPYWVGGRLVIFKGVTPQRALAVEHALRTMQSHSSMAGMETTCCKVLVPAEKVGHVVGENGSILRWLQENFAVQPVIGNEEVAGEYLLTVHGTPACVLEASKQVVGLLDVDAGQAQCDPQQQASQNQYSGGVCAASQQEVFDFGQTGLADVTQQFLGQTATGFDQVLGGAPQQHFQPQQQLPMQLQLVPPQHHQPQQMQMQPQFQQPLQQPLFQQQAQAQLYPEGDPAALAAIGGEAPQNFGYQPTY